jgi:hypothetical protein
MRTTWSGEEYKVWSPSLCQRLQVTCVSVAFLTFVFGKLSDLNVVCLSAGHRILGSVILFTTVLWPGDGVVQSVIWLAYRLHDRGSIPCRFRYILSSPPRPDRHEADHLSLSSAEGTFTPPDVFIAFSSLEPPFVSPSWTLRFTWLAQKTWPDIWMPGGHPVTLCSLWHSTVPQVIDSLSV